MLVNQLAGRNTCAYQTRSTEEEFMAGLFLEEFQPGTVFRHQLTKTVTESDNMLFSVMTLNPQPLHIDFDFAAKSEWGKPLVNSLFTLGLMIGISVHDTTLGTTIGNLGMTETVFPHPVFHGDTIRVETEVKSVRESKSRPDRGIVEFEHRAYNQDGKLVARCTRQAMIRKRAA
jgi:acyl dehydratase